MQRRRSTPQNRADRFQPATSYAASASASTTASASAAIELRDRRAHATSSSISSLRRPLRASADTAAYPPPSSVPAPRVPFHDTPFIMRPLVSAVQAWSCVVISVFAIVILSVLGLLFRSNHHEMVGGIDDPVDGPAVAGTIFVAVLIYAGFLMFCGLQGALHLRENRRGAIALQ